MCVSMANTIQEERWRWLKPIINKEITPVSSVMIWAGVAVLTFGLTTMLIGKEGKKALLAISIGGLALLAGNAVQWIF
jgi:hypothetical protein